MSSNQLSLRGFDDVFQLLLGWLNEPEKTLLSGSDAEARLSKPLSDFLQEFAIQRWLDLDNVLFTAELYKRSGRSETEVRKITVIDTEKFMETYNALSILRRLVDDQVLCGARVVRVEIPGAGERKE